MLEENKDASDELQRGLYPIVGVDLQAYGRTGQHAQVVAGLTSRAVLLHDPLLGRFKTNLLAFEQAWSLSDFLTILVE
jgi:predicted double-glycine peptidase